GDCTEGSLHRGQRQSCSFVLYPSRRSARSAEAATTESEHLYDAGGDAARRIRDEPSTPERKAPFACGRIGDHAGTGRQSDGRAVTVFPDRRRRAGMGGGRDSATPCRLGSFRRRIYNMAAGKICTAVRVRWTERIGEQDRSAKE